MCLMIYLGSDKERPTSNWNATDSKFFVENNNIQYAVEKQRYDDTNEVKSKFSKQNIYYVGSHEGCGCGFRREWFWYQEDKEEINKTNQNQKYLFEFVSDCLKNEESIEIYACWAGNESEFAKSKREISAEEIIKKDFFFKEDEFIVVKK